MSDGTAIEWTDATLNVINGCDVVSPGCTNCYAMRSGARGLPNHPATGLTKPSKPDRVGADGSVIKSPHVWTGEVRFNDKALLLPLRWKRPRKIFWNAHGDMFHPKVPDEWIDRCFAVMALTPQHIHQVLTKRPERMRDYLQRRRAEKPVMVAIGDGTRGFHPFNCEVKPPSNVWLGVSVEDQQRADERIPLLLDTPAAVRWLSCEPLLGPVDLTDITGAERSREYGSAVHGWSCIWRNNGLGRLWIDWVVAGGESGRGARPMHPAWARQLRDACAQAGVPFLFKQWGDWRLGMNVDPDLLNRFEFERRYLDEGTSGPFYRLGKKRAGRLLDGALHEAYPQ